MMKLVSHIHHQCNYGSIPARVWRSKLGGNSHKGLRKASQRPPPRLPLLLAVKASSGAEATTSVSASSAIAPHHAPPAVEQDVAADWPSEEVDASSEVVIVEEKIEKVIYGCRFMALLGVAGSLIGSIICFLKGCTYVINSFIEQYVSGGRVTLMLVEAIDVYLIGTVMLIFGMGLYEIFISNLDIAKMSSCGSNLLGLFRLQERPRWLDIQSINALKTKVGHVIVMVLLVGMFEKSKKVTISTPGDLLCFAASILLCSGGLYLLSKLKASAQSKHA